MRKNANLMNIEGKVYQHDLKEKVTGETSKAPGTPYISGTIDIATNAAQDNIVQVHYTYVAPTYSNGGTNKSYGALKSIIESGKTVFNDGYDAATTVRLNPSYTVNDFIPQGQETMVTAPRNEGGFVTIVPELSLAPEGDIKRNRFEFDIVISNVEEVVPEEGDPYVKVKGVAFDFRNALLPVTLTVRNPDGGRYFLNLGADASNPVYTKVWGKIVSVFTKTEKTIESAFGEATVDTVVRRSKEYVITGANPVPYEFDTDETITAGELQKALQDREIHLAEVKKNIEEYRASKNSGNTASAFGSAPAAKPAASVPQGGFKF